MSTMIKFVRSMFVVVWLMILLGAMESTSAISAEVEPRMASPLAYQWHTFYGVTDSIGETRSIGVDGAGNVYVASYTNKSWGTPLHPYSGDYDLMVMKLNSLGQYQWHTYYGASPTSGTPTMVPGRAQPMRWAMASPSPPMAVRCTSPVQPQTPGSATGIRPLCSLSVAGPGLAQTSWFSS